MNRLLLLRRALMSASAKLVKLLVTGASGIVSFVTGVAKPMSVTCEFGPVQASGTPSPINVLPISGWTGVEIEQRKANLFDKSTLISGRYVNSSGGLSNSSNYSASDYIEIPSSGSIYVSGFGTGSGAVCLCFYKADQTFLNSAGQQVAGTYSIPSGAKYVRMSVRNGYADTAMLSIGTTAPTGYEAYTGRTLPITFPSSAGTVYGGSITVNEDGSGVLTSEWRHVDLGSMSWSLYNGRFESGYLNNCRKANGILSVYCEVYKGIPNTAYPDEGEICFNPTGGNTYLRVRDTNYSTAADFKASLSGKYAVCRLLQANQQTYNLTAEEVGQILSYNGTNNVWHDMNGSISVEYYNKQ